MNGVLFLLILIIGALGVTWYVEENAERMETDREIAALVRESKRHEGRRQGRNPARFACCGWCPPPLSRKERRAIRRAGKGRH